MTTNNPVNSSVKATRTLRMAIVTFGLFVGVMTANHFRLELFGIVPGYAPHNFGFNMLFFIPANLLIILGCFIVIARTLINWNHWRKPTQRIIPLCLTLPIIVEWIFVLFEI
jgi:hypothetical protein